MAKKAKARRVYDEDFKREAVQMLQDGYSATSVAERLGISCPSTIRRWKSQQLADAGPMASAMDSRLKESYKVKISHQLWPRVMRLNGRLFRRSVRRGTTRPCIELRKPHRLWWPTLSCYGKGSSHVER
jgi:hypothetical protein